MSQAAGESRGIEIWEASRIAGSFMAFVLMLACCAVAGCAQQPFYSGNEQHSLPRALPNDYAISRDDLGSPPTGTFDVNYIPALLSEPKDVREARDKLVAAHISASVSNDKFSRNFDVVSGDYEIFYDYSTIPNISTGLFTHEFSAKIRKNTDKASEWFAKAIFEKQPSEDIAIYLPSLIVKAFEKYPYR